MVEGESKRRYLCAIDAAVKAEPCVVGECSDVGDPDVAVLVYGHACAWTVGAAGGQSIVNVEYDLRVGPTTHANDAGTIGWCSPSAV